MNVPFRYVFQVRILKRFIFIRETFEFLLRRMISPAIDVLIVGAGPTGLMLACQLSLYSNISFRIVDKNAGCTTQSRAIAVHARSLEVLAQMNLVEKALANGTAMDAMKVFIRGQDRIHLDFTFIRAKQQPLLTQYPYILFLDQATTEEMLETFLHEHHVKVERNTEATDLIDFDSSDDNGVEVKLSTGETIRAKYICACDGARSIVRHKLNLPFSGRTYSESLFVADCGVSNSPIGKKESGIFYDTTGLLGIFPLPNDRYRFIGTFRDESSEHTDINFQDVVAMSKARTRHPDLDMSNCSWISIYHSHHRRVAAFRCRKRYFLLGDAAHIHSPVGGQGMNTGLQDAHNLAWKLAYVLTHSASDHLLDTYHDERSAVAKTLVDTTDRIFSFVTSPHWFTSLLRLYILPFLLRFIVQPLLNASHTVRQAAFKRNSQLGITYRASVDGHGSSAGSFHRDTPHPGDRFPYIIYDPYHYHLVIFENQQSVKVNQFVQFITQQYGKIIKIHDPHEENIPFEFDGAILIRPDGYIAYRTTVFDVHHFENYFTQFFSNHTL